MFPRVIGRGPTRGLFASLVLGCALLTLASCSGHTQRATSVGSSSATLNGARQCISAVDGRWTWQWRQLGTGPWKSGGASQQTCVAAGGRAQGFSYRPPGLKPDTSYQFRLSVDPKLPCDVLRTPAECIDVYPLDSTGTVNGTRYHTFTTQPVCDDVQGASESLAAFVSSNPAGAAGDRRVLCLRAGTQSIGQVNGVKAWTTLTPRGEADGTKQSAVLNGNLALQSRGATVEDVRIVGCWRQAGCDGDRDKVIDVRASDVKLSHLDITQKGGRNADIVQCVLIDSSTQLRGVTVEFSKIHSCGSESSGNMEHGIYCSRASGAVISGNWIYDNEGFGIQLYPDCDDALAVGNVVAENGASCDVDRSTGTAYANGFCGFGRENASRPIFPPIHCGPTTANRAIEMVVFDPTSVSPVSDCGSQLSATGTLRADPEFVNRGAYDFRMRNPSARAKLGIFADISPGPRW
jgi:parallel beta helix pectate lyase-like protein